MRLTPPLPAVAAAAVAALLLAGCSAGGDTPSDDETGPLSAFFEQVGGSFEDEDYEAQQRQVEDLVAACMAEEGFEYTPAEPMSSGGRIDSDDMPDWESKEFAEQYGYGATTSDDLWGGGGGEEYVDPNADYVASMSESEQAAFYEALYGVAPEIDPDADPEAEVEYEYNWEEAGCQGRASHEVYEQGQIWDDPAMQDLMEDMSSEYENLADDPKVREAQDAWAECIAEAGYDFASPEEAQQSIYDEQNALYEAVMPTDPEAEIDPEASFEPDEAAMAELKEKELALAVADWECKDSSGYQAAQKAANLAMEKRLWDKYGEQLQAFADKQTPAK